MDEETLITQIERLKRAIRTAGPPLADGERRRPPLVLSAATREGVQDTLRALAGAIGTAKAEEQARAKPAEWRP